MPGTFELPGRYSPGFCAKPKVSEDQSVLVKLGLKKEQQEPCGTRLVRFRGVLVCPVCTEIVTGINWGDSDMHGGLELKPEAIREPLGQVFPNRRARRAA